MTSQFKNWEKKFQQHSLGGVDQTLQIKLKVNKIQIVTAMVANINPL